MAPEITKIEREKGKEGLVERGKKERKSGLPGS